MKYPSICRSVCELSIPVDGWKVFMIQFIVVFMHEVCL